MKPNGKSIKEQGKWKREETKGYWLMKAQWRMMEVWTLLLHQADQDLFWTPRDHGTLAVTDSTGTHVQVTEDRVCILQDYKTCVTPKLWTAPLHRQPSYKTIILSFEHPNQATFVIITADQKRVHTNNRGKKPTQPKLEIQQTTKLLFHYYCTAALESEKI